MVASFFDTQEYSVSNREFNTVTGTYKGKRMTVLSTGIGIGNIDISGYGARCAGQRGFRHAAGEGAEAAAHAGPFPGTSGAIQPDIKVGQFVFARTSVGFDGLLNYYKGRNEVCDLEIEKAFMKHTGWSDLLPKPYFIDADPSLAELFRDVTIEGITIAAPASMRRRTLGASRTGRHPSEREDRVVRLSRTPGHQFRDGKFCFGRAGRSHGPQSRHDLYDHRSADRAGRLHGL